MTSINCDECPAGSSSEAGSSKCQPCEAGTYSNIIGQACKSCDVGLFRKAGTDAKSLFSFYNSISGCGATVRFFAFPFTTPNPTGGGPPTGAVGGVTVLIR